MNRSHIPAAAFRKSLEQHITDEMRRSTAPLSLMGRSRRQRLRSGAVLTAAVALGVLAGAAPAQVQDARTRSALLVGAQAEERLSVIRHELARTAYEEARKRFAIGAIGQESLAAAEAELRAMESAVHRNRLNQEEIRVTAASPRDDISAPLVGQRDFVTERLHLDLAAAQQRLVSAERAVADAQRRHSVGAIARGPLLDAQIDLARATSEIQSISMRVQLRQQFLAGTSSVEEVEARLRRNELMLTADLTGKLHARATEHLADLREQHAAGVIDQLEVLRAELDVMERAFEMERIARSLEALDAARDSARDQDPPA